MAFHSFDRPDLLLELGDRRTEILGLLMKIFEEYHLKRFKVYVSNTLLIKE
jgi:hypothetical protein